MGSRDGEDANWWRMTGCAGRDVEEALEASEVEFLVKNLEVFKIRRPKL